VVSFHVDCTVHPPHLKDTLMPIDDIVPSSAGERPAIGSAGTNPPADINPDEPIRQRSQQPGRREGATVESEADGHDVTPAERRSAAAKKAAATRKANAEAARERAREAHAAAYQAKVAALEAKLGRKPDIFDMIEADEEEGGDEWIVDVDEFGRPLSARAELRRAARLKAGG
jgi:hypothetical protein